MTSLFNILNRIDDNKSLMENSHNLRYVLAYHNGNNYVYWRGSQGYYEEFTDKLDASVKTFTTAEQAAATASVQEVDAKYRELTDYHSTQIFTMRANELPPEVDVTTNEFYDPVSFNEENPYFLIIKPSSGIAFWDGVSFDTDFSDAYPMEREELESNKRFAYDRLDSEKLFKPHKINSRDYTILEEYDSEFFEDNNITLTPIEMELVDEIAAKYVTSSPLSGTWETEIDAQLQDIADTLNISKEAAKNIMINYLGFSEEEFGIKA